LSIGFAVIGSDLCREFVVADAGRRVELRFGLDLVADAQRDVSGKRNALDVFRYVEISLVER
jgi:hypothetical protein